MSHFCRRHRSAKKTWKTGSVPLWSWPQVGRHFAPSFFFGKVERAQNRQQTQQTQQSGTSKVWNDASEATRGNVGDPNVVPMLSTGVEFLDITTSCIRGFETTYEPHDNHHHHHRGLVRVRRRRRLRPAFFTVLSLYSTVLQTQGEESSLPRSARHTVQYSR